MVAAEIVRTLRQDVEEIPDVIARLLEREEDRAREMGQVLRRRRTSWLLVVGRGSSDNAGRYGQYLFGAEHRLAVAQATPSLFTRYGTPPRLDGATVVAVSASGASRDVVAVVEEAVRQRRPVLALTNDPGSPLAAAAPYVLPLHAGPQRGPTATKSYVASLAAFAMLSAVASDDDAMWADLRALPAALARLLRDPGDIAGAASLLTEATRAMVVGRGFNYATASELALKLTALTRTPTVAYSAADVIRGPAPTVGAPPTLLIAPSGRVLSDVIDLIPELRERGARLAVLSDLDDVLSEADHPLRLPTGVREWLSPLTSVVPGQLLALEVARRQGALNTLR